jgi:hypothetical protein
MAKIAVVNRRKLAFVFTSGIQFVVDAAARNIDLAYLNFVKAYQARVRKVSDEECGCY